MGGKQIAGLILVVVVILGLMSAKGLKNRGPSPAVTEDTPATPASQVSLPGVSETAAGNEENPNTSGAETELQAADSVRTPAAQSKPLPKLLELGSHGCIACEQMAPIIAALKEELAGKVAVEFHDVGQNPEIAERYQIRVIPTQVFLDAGGKELFRHVGVLEKEEILAKMRELGMLRE